MFNLVYEQKRVFVTGHTGFKGSWLFQWLNELDAIVCGYALPAPTKPSHFEALDKIGHSIIDDIRNTKAFKQAILDFDPHIVFHLAAQPSVLASYQDPVETYSTNVLGTVNLLEALRESESIQAIVVVSTDKCYENKEWCYGYRETDALGGHDPYSASKACLELVVNSYRKSFFEPNNIPIASVRAGNVIGGGDWTVDRLVPDLVKAAQGNQPIIVRNPLSKRPWQHVLDPLSGYLRVGQLMLEQANGLSEAWNFGPDLSANITTSALIQKAQTYWPEIKYSSNKEQSGHHEAGLLMLDSTKAKSKLDWQPIWDIDKAIEKTLVWYKQFDEHRLLTRQQITEFSQDAQEKGVAWAIN